MPMTAVEKIISNHVGRNVEAGDIVVTPVDFVMAQDGNAPLAIRIMRDELKATQTFDRSRVILVIDHCAPSPDERTSNLQRMMREFAEEFGAIMFDIGSGISHVVLPEKGYVQPGTIVVGSDSHSVTYGALNCLGTGMGSTDIAVTMYTGKTWLRVPETTSVTLTGHLPSNVTSKDLGLAMIRSIGVDGATYQCVEIGGPGLGSLGMDSRFTICSLGIEVGAKCMLMPVDDVSLRYMKGIGCDASGGVNADAGCMYQSSHEIDLDRLEPLVALPHDLTRIVSAQSQQATKIDQAFIGTCTNSRFEDLAAAAAVLSGRQVAAGVRLIVTPGSRDVYLEALREGHIETFVTSGAVVTPPGCGACVGTHLGIPADGETVISTANRNFKGRMGNANAEIILGSPETVAASAVVGRVATAGSLH